MPYLQLIMIHILWAIYEWSNSEARNLALFRVTAREKDGQSGVGRDVHIFFRLSLWY